MSSDWLVGIGAFVTALTGAHVALRRQIKEIHVIINSQFDRLQDQLREELRVAIEERDSARTERDEK